MKRPFSDKRPIGPFGNFSFRADLEPSTERLQPNEVRVLLGRMADNVEDEADVLEKTITGNFEDDPTPPLEERENTFIVEQLLSGAKRTRRIFDSSAEKLAGMHEEMTGRIPDSFREYEEQADRRDEAIEEIERIL